MAVSDEFEGDMKDEKKVSRRRLKTSPQSEEAKDKAAEWDRFERAVDIALHTPPMPKPTKPVKPKKKPK